jgi:hypothetical protein
VHLGCKKGEKMGIPGKINVEELKNLILKEGKDLKKCAAHFNCSIPAISLRLKAAGLKIVKTTTLEKERKIDR